ncbi:MAG: hypothetical protein A3K09_00795 [Nitrospinae bacterium RIFCSPLOWO2_12_FULL_47_7]|nr:MAG: hypothetical protein A3K09_00795 [Nitrospinae bacterium RIFCSPLOWO2_12_FULL_47_7]
MENTPNPDLVLIMDAFMASMEFDDNGGYIRDLALIDRFEKSHLLYDADYEVIDCSYNSSLTGFCSSLRADLAPKSDPRIMSDRAA